MAKRTVCDCDRCGSKSVPTREVFVTVDTFTDEAGSRDTDQRSFDMCVRCLQTEISGFLSQLTLPQRQDWVAKITKQPYRDRHGKVCVQK